MQAENDANAALDTLTNARQRAAVQLALATQQVCRVAGCPKFYRSFTGRSETAGGPCTAPLSLHLLGYSAVIHLEFLLNGSNEAL